MKSASKIKTITKKPHWIGIWAIFQWLQALVSSLTINRKTKICKLSYLFFHLTTFISSDPEQFTKEILSPATSNTPEPSQDDIGIGKLVSNVEELRKSLSIIREKSVTPINSPRGASNATTPNTAVKRDIIPQSPPTKDTDNKLQDMRYVGFWTDYCNEFFLSNL